VTFKKVANGIHKKRKIAKIHKKGKGATRDI
jgi:hypothetical protein